jgi:hypothetical protein
LDDFTRAKVLFCEKYSKIFLQLITGLQQRVLYTGCCVGKTVSAVREKNITSPRNSGIKYIAKVKIRKS